MKSIGILICLPACAWILAAGCRNSDSSYTLKSMLPSSTERCGWKTAGACEIVAGENLYLVIDGGAELVLEYGFHNALFQSYGLNELSINLEIYEMEDSESAYGLFSIKKGRGTSADIGQESQFEDYFLQFWKDRYLVVLVGFDDDTLTIQGIYTLARAVESRIKKTGSHPDLIGLLPEKEKILNIRMVEGPLGLGVLEPFEYSNRIPVHEGILGSYSDRNLLILRYPNSRLCGDAFYGYRRLAEDGLIGKILSIGDSTFTAAGKPGLLHFERRKEILTISIKNPTAEQPQ